MKISKCVLIFLTTVVIPAFASAAPETPQGKITQAANSAEILPAALAQAKSQNKKVMVLFSGLEWCMPCRVFDKNVIKKPVFEKFARNELVLVEFDMKRNGAVSLATNAKEPSAPAVSDTEIKRQARLLMDKFGVRGVPCAVILDGDGREIFRHEGCGIGAEDFVKAVRDAK